MGALNVHTTTLTNGLITINEFDNVVRISIMCRLGTITVLGSVPFQGQNSTTVALNEGQGVTITTPNISIPVSGVQINAGSSGDIADIIISYQ